MDLATLVSAAVQASVCLIVFSLGLGSTREDALYLLRRPRQLVRSLLSMNVVMPLVAAGLAAVFDFPGALNISLVALAVSPVPPILPMRQLRAGGPRILCGGTADGRRLASHRVHPVRLEADCPGLRQGRARPRGRSS